MAEALRKGEPIDLRLVRPPPAELRLDEIAPLCRSISCDNARVAAELCDSLAPGPLPRSAQRSPGPAVTAIIPCHQHPPVGLAALHSQDLPVRVLVLSNGAHGPRVVPGADVLRLPWQGHGATRQAAIAHVTDPYVLLTVHDAIPLGVGFVRTLVTALEDGGWDAVFARQIPWPDADPVTRSRLRQWTPSGDRVVAAAQLDHVAALYRTETLRAHPLPAVPIAEDACWSVGRRIGYVPMAPILHSHTRQPRALYRRNRDIHAQLVQLGQPPTVPSFSAVIAALPGVLRPVVQGGRGELANQLAELVGQWRGARMGLRAAR